MTDLQERGDVRPDRRGALDRLDTDTFVADPLRMARPLVPRGSVVRRPLLERLRRCADRPLLLVVAPTGSGKTTTLAQWSATDPRPTVWLTLCELDNDPVYLLRHLTLALDQVDPLPDEVFEPLTRAVPPLMTVAVPRLGRALYHRDEPVAIVLDDVHLVRSAESLHCIQGVLAHLSPGSTIALSGRAAPDFALSRLRVGGLVAELGADDLAMSVDEAAALFDHAELDVPAASVELLVERTEGWVAGLALAALAGSAGATDPGGSTVEMSFDGMSFDGDHRLVAEYVRSEILTTIDDAIVSFLMRVSVLDTLSGALCDELLETAGSALLLERLAQDEQLFVVALDDTRQRYRIQHLVARALRAELHAQDPSTERALHRRASELLEGDGNADAAIRHARAAGDLDRAGQLVLDHALVYGISGRNATVGLWLELFDDDERRLHPALALSTAWHEMGRGNSEAVEHWADAAQATSRSLAPPRLAEFDASIAIYRSIVCVDGVGRMAEYTRPVRELGTADNPWWGLATMLHGVAEMMMGRTDEGGQLLRAAYEASPHMPTTRAVSDAQLAFLALRAGDSTEAVRRITRALDVLATNRLEEYLPIIPVFSIAALIRAEVGDVVGARRHALTTRRLMGSLGHLAPRAQLQACVLLARVELRLGELAAAREMVDEARRVAPREPEARLVLDDLDEVGAALERREHPERQLSVGPAALTGAELRVLELMPTHLSLGEIAGQLYVSRNTVKTHAISTYRKLGVSSRSAAVGRARELGLIEL